LEYLAGKAKASETRLGAKAEGTMENAEMRGKAGKMLDLAPEGPQSWRLRAAAEQRSAPHLNRSAAGMPQESGLDKLS
jgi:hypothetical protein